MLAITGTGLAGLAGCFTVSETETEGSSGETTTDAPSTDTTTDGPAADTTVASEATDGTSSADAVTPTSDGTLPAPVAGDPDADVTVAVLEDFACPHCKTFNEDVYPDIRSEYIDPGTIRYEHHDFPIPVDESVSWEAPNAARTVQANLGDEAFFEYANLLFANQNSLGRDTYASLASEVGADGETVRRGAVRRRYNETVGTDRERGIEMGVRGTPAAFVNGEQVSTSFEALSSAIDDASSDST